MGSGGRKERRCKSVRSRKSKFTRSVVLLLALLAAGCSTLFAPERPNPALSMPALETRIVTLIDEVRTKRDPKAHLLAVDPELVIIARKRSTDMAKDNSFAVNSDPHPAATALMDADATFQGMIGENVAAQHFTPGQAIDVNLMARRFVDSWVASKPHLDNLSFPDFDHTGVGAAVNADTIYVTTLFTTDLGLGKIPDPAKPDIRTVPSPQQGKSGSQNPAASGTAPASGSKPPSL